MRRLRVAVLVGVVFAGLLVAWPLGERHVGNRIFLANASACDIVVSDEHGGATIRPGHRELVRSGFIDHSPSMLVATRQQAWTGVRFHERLVNVRTADGNNLDISIPPNWWHPTSLGRELTFEVDGTGRLVLRAPLGAVPGPQPSGFPLPSLPAGMPIQKELTCH